MIEHLPRNSAYAEALALDQSLLDRLERPTRGKREQPRPKVREWSAEVELLAAIFDRLNGVIQIQSKKNLHLKPWPRPITAAEVMRAYKRRQTRSRLEQLVADAQRQAAAQEN